MPLRQRHPHQTHQPQRLQVNRVNIVVQLLIIGRYYRFYSRAAIVLAYILVRDSELHSGRLTALGLSTFIGSLPKAMYFGCTCSL